MRRLEAAIPIALASPLPGVECSKAVESARVAEQRIGYAAFEELRAEKQRGAEAEAVARRRDALARKPVFHARRGKDTHAVYAPRVVWARFDGRLYVHLQLIIIHGQKIAEAEAGELNRGNCLLPPLQSFCEAMARRRWLYEQRGY